MRRNSGGSCIFFLDRNGNAWTINIGENETAWKNEMNRKSSWDEWEKKTRMKRREKRGERRERKEREGLRTDHRKHWQLRKCQGKSVLKKRHQRTTRVIEGKYENVGPWELRAEEVKFQKPSIKFSNNEDLGNMTSSNVHEWWEQNLDYSGLRNKSELRKHRRWLIESIQHWSFATWLGWKVIVIKTQANS